MVTVTTMAVVMEAVVVGASKVRLWPATVLPSSYYTLVNSNSNKAKPVERRGRKATGPRFLRDAFNIATEGPTTAELPKRAEH